MNYKNIILAVISIANLVNISYSQIGTALSGERTVDWRFAGTQSFPSVYQNMIDVTKATSYPVLSSNNAATNSTNFAMLLSLRNKNEMTLFYFPQGTYLFSETILLDSNIVIRGDGAFSTIFSFNGADNAFTIRTNVTVLSFDGNPIVSGKEKGSKAITFSNPLNISSVKPFDLIDIYNIDDWPNWTSDPDEHIKIGQTNTFVGLLNNNTVQLKDELRIDYGFDYFSYLTTSFPTKIKIFQNPANDVAIENLSIHDHSSETSGKGENSILIDKARNCRISGVESYNPLSAHISIRQSTNIEITGCDFHHAKSYGGGGRGYGVNIGLHSSNVLVENNTFSYLRHAMILSWGANGNVFGYNFSRDIQNDNPLEFDTQDVAFHGHFPFANLFEGNIVQFVFADGVWGINGPYNTIFRNKIEKEAGLLNIQQNAPNGGVRIDLPDGYTFGIQEFNYLGNILADVHDTFFEQNNQHNDALITGWIYELNAQIGNVSDDYGTNDISYYKLSKPNFLNNTSQIYTWPPIGSLYNQSQSLPTQYLPAAYRWNNPITINGNQKKTLDAPIYQTKFNIEKYESIEGILNINGGKYFINGEDKGESWTGEYNSATTLLIDIEPPQGFTFTKWSDGVTTKSRTVDLKINKSLKGILKKSLTSNNVNALFSTSQRKIARTNDPSVLHMVYESAGSVWYETSYDEGGNWTIMNNGQPLGYGSLPSIACIDNSVGNADAILIAYQAGSSGIIVKCFSRSIGSNNFIFLCDAPGIESHLFSGLDATPVIATKKDPSYASHEFYVVWRGAKYPDMTGQKRLRFYSGILNGGINSSNFLSINSYANGEIQNSTSNSQNPSIASNPDVGTYQLVWQEGSSTILYKSISYDTTQGLTSSISNGNGYDYNYSPSIIATASINYPARVSWVGKRWIEDVFEKSQSEGGHWEYNTIFNDPSSQGSFWIFGDAVSSTNININKNDNGYIVSWTKSNNTSQYTRNSSLGGTILDFKKSGSIIIGKDIQVIPGISFDNMYGLIAETQNSLYQLTKSDKISYLGKNGGYQQIFSGREGIVAFGNAQFYFTLGDIIVNGVQIEFPEVSDSTTVNTKELVNQYLTSNPFVLNDNSDFSFGVLYGFVDSIKSATLLRNSKIEFKVQLIDELSKEVLGEYDNIQFTSSNLYKYNNIGYQVNTNGIGERVVRLKLVVGTNIDAKYGLSSKHNNKSITSLNKQAGKKHITYKGALAIDRFVLEQNYPNPFNPVTTINYAIPKSGNVIFKIYDVLGKEVMTLVNKHQESGRYSVYFDGSNLASGMYIYKLTSGTFSEVKKMMLVK
jgi:hypothetical protein